MNAEGITSIARLIRDPVERPCRGFFDRNHFCGEMRLKLLHEVAVFRTALALPIYRHARDSFEILATPLRPIVERRVRVTQGLHATSARIV